MDFPSLKKQLQTNSNSSFRHFKKASATGSNDSRNDGQVIIKVDGGNGWSSNNGRQEMAAIADEMKLMSKQKVEDDRTGSRMNLQMGEFRGDSQEPNFPRTSIDSSSSSSLMHQSMAHEIRVSFEPSVSSSIDNPATHHHQHHPHQQQQQEQQQKIRVEQVLRCTSNATFQRQPSLLSRVKTKSRLLDLPLGEAEMMSGKIVRTSGQLKSGFLSRVMMEEDEEDDPLEDDDLPDEYKKDKVSAFTVLQWLSLVAITAGLGCSLLIVTLREAHFLKLKLWKWEVLLLVLICGRLVSGWGIRVIVFLIERNFLLRKRVLYFVYGLRKGVQNCLWLGIVLLAWHYLFDKRIERETGSHFLKYLTKILICFLVGNCIWLVKTLMVKVLASSFHVSTYFDRIQESLFNQYVIETLSGKPLVEVKRSEKEMDGIELKKKKKNSKKNTVSPIGKGTRFSREVSNKGEDGIRIDHLHKLNMRNVSAWNMKRLMNIVKHGSLSTLDEQIHGSGATIDDESATHIRSEYQAKSAARKIFYNVARPGSKYIYLVDLMRFMREDEALKILSFFEGASDTSKISKSSLKNWVVRSK